MLDHNTLTPDVETASDAYARRFGGPVGTYFLEQQTTAVARLLSKPSAAGRRALDVGGGHGHSLLRFCCSLASMCGARAARRSAAAARGPSARNQSIRTIARGVGRW